MPRPGQVLAGKYRLTSELGRGGMGSVWCAEHLVLHSRVALKLIEPTRATGEGGAAQFLREARLAAGLNSQHVVKIFDYGLAGENPFIAMELLDGETLRRRLARVGSLPLPEVQKVVRQIAFGVERAHQAGIVHRDLKPDNIFIVSGEEAELIKVLDFGIAKSLASSMLECIPAVTPTGALLGTPHYMSPEQATGSKSLDQRTDVWSLGVITFEALLGQTPFRGDTLGGLIVTICSLPLPVPSELGAVPPGFDAWFSRACARELSERFGSVRELSEALALLRASDPALLRASDPALLRASDPALLRARDPALRASDPAARASEQAAPRAQELHATPAAAIETTARAVSTAEVPRAELSPRSRWRRRQWALLALLLAAGAASAALLLRSAEHPAEPASATAAVPSTPVPAPPSAAPAPPAPAVVPPGATDAPLSPSVSTSALEPRPSLSADAPRAGDRVQRAGAVAKAPAPDRARPAAAEKQLGADEPPTQDTSAPRNPRPGARPEDPYNLGF